METVNRLTDVLVTMNTPADRGKLFKIIKMLYGLMGLPFSEEAKICLREINKYDLLVLDVTLPDGTGFDVCEKVRKQNAQIPIIFLTASDEEVNVIRGLDCGGDDYVTKLFKLGKTSFFAYALGGAFS